MSEKAVNKKKFKSFNSQIRKNDRKIVSLNKILFKNPLKLKKMSGKYVVTER